MDASVFGYMDGYRLRILCRSFEGTSVFSVALFLSLFDVVVIKVWMLMRCFVCCCYWHLLSFSLSFIDWVNLSNIEGVRQISHKRVTTADNSWQCHVQYALTSFDPGSSYWRKDKERGMDYLLNLRCLPSADVLSDCLFVWLVSPMHLCLHCFICLCQSVINSLLVTKFIDKQLQYFSVLMFAWKQYLCLHMPLVLWTKHNWLSTLSAISWWSGPYAFHIWLYYHMFDAQWV